MPKPKKTKEPPKKVMCLYCDEVGRECNHIRPVVTQEALVEIKEHYARLDALKKKYGVK